MNSITVQQQIESIWNISFFRIREDVSLYGSPERMKERIVFEGVKGELFILEQLSEEMVQRKREIAELLDLLAKTSEVPITPYIKSIKGRFIEEYEGACWQIAPYTHGVPLDRTAYMFDRWRGEASVDALTGLYKAIDNHKDVLNTSEDLCIASYVHTIHNAIRMYRTDIYARAGNIVSFLNEGLFTREAELPKRICHGDFHPMNIIWGERSIRAVIDWEFFGEKLELYDVALMVGCLGIEDPSALKEGFTQTFISGMQRSQLFSNVSWEYFFGLVLAIRFGWLSEWFRKSDADMIEMEMDYMELLMEEQSNLVRAWGV
jgi:homoserine kinase type II